MMRTLWCGCLILCLASPALAQVEPKSGGAQPPTNPAQMGTPVGTVSLSGHVTAGDDAPSFELPSTTGRDRSLHSLKGDWVVLLFMPRKGDFVPFQKVVAEFAKLPATIVGITFDNPQSLRALAKKEKLSFELLGDPTGEVSASYGLFDGPSNTTRAGVIVVDRRGMVRLVVSGQTLPPAEVLSLTSLTIEGS